MKKLNRKGFTLIELLAVVVILLAISVIAVSSISAAIERNKEKQNEAKKDIILSYAKLYYDEHKNTLGDNGCITLSDLENYLSDTEKKDANDKDIIASVKYYKSGNDIKFEFKNSSLCS